jgi:Ca2+-binding EF-hand superfamily protein
MVFIIGLARRYIDFREFLEGAMHLRTLKDESKIKEAFDQFDVNGDGVVSKAELVSYVAGVWFAPAQRRSADTNVAGLPRMQ